MLNVFFIFFHSFLSSILFHESKIILFYTSDYSPNSETRVSIHQIKHNLHNQQERIANVQTYLRTKIITSLEKETSLKNWRNSERWKSAVTHTYHISFKTHPSTRIHTHTITIFKKINPSSRFKIESPTLSPNYTASRIKKENSQRQREREKERELKWKDICVSWKIHGSFI